MRISSLALPVAIIALSVFSLVMVSRIVALGGAHYRWEYIPPILTLAVGFLRLWAWIKGLYR